MSRAILVMSLLAASPLAAQATAEEAASGPLTAKSVEAATYAGSDLPVLKENQTYQLWTLAGPLTAPTRVTPDALVGGGNAVKQWFTGPVAQSDALAISIEQAGGATAPTNLQGATAF